MRKLLFLLILNLSHTHTYSSEFIIKNNDDSLKIKSWTREDFIKEFGFNDSAKALVNLFFIKNKRAKNQTIIGTAFLTGGIIALANPAEPGDDQKGVGDLIRPAFGPAALAFGTVITTSGIIKLPKYTKEKLYILLSNYKKGITIPRKYSKKLKRKFFR